MQSIRAALNSDSIGCPNQVTSNCCIWYCSKPTTRTKNVTVQSGVWGSTACVLYDRHEHAARRWAIPKAPEAKLCSVSNSSIGTVGSIVRSTDSLQVAKGATLTRSNVPVNRPVRPVSTPAKVTPVPFPSEREKSQSRRGKELFHRVLSLLLKVSP